MKIKICGVTNVPDARLCADEGADYIGLIFAEISPRKVTLAQARRIVSALPGTVTPVAVVMDQDLKVVEEIRKGCGAKLVQLHGHEDTRYVRAAGGPLIKVFDSFSKRDLARLRRYDVYAYMMDLPKQNGSRRMVDLHFAINAKNYGRVILSGALTPENVADRIRQVGPFAVDVCSSTELKPGRKDKRRLRAFIETVRG